MTPPRTTVRALLCGMLLFAAVDLGLFRSGLYAWLAKPNSSLGWFTRHTRFEPLARPPVEQPSVLLLGDSTMGEAGDERALRSRLGGRGTFTNAAVPGSTPRVWPYLFAQMPAPPGGWRYVVVGLRDFDDDGAGPMGERRHDLSFLGPALGLADACVIAGEFRDAAARREVWLSALCKAHAWRRDLQDLLAAPYQRYLEVRRQFGWLRWGQPYAGRDGSMVGIGVEGDRVVGLRPDQHDALQQLTHLVWRRDVVDDSGHRRRWLGELVDRVTATGAQVVFVRMPSQLLPRAAARVPATAVLDELARRPGVHVLPFDAFAELERPECFFDALHVNRAARTRFTELLAEALRARFPADLGR
ncbi:MAG: hypothetical protein KF830_08860 [Planctomycetes bacterium]|nr:hypothetical protein [Planctomycetota bacterium]